MYKYAVYTCISIQCDVPTLSKRFNYIMQSQLVLAFLVKQTKLWQRFWNSFRALKIPLGQHFRRQLQCIE